MSADRQVNDIEGFCRLLAASGLVTQDSIDSLIANFRSNAEHNSKYGASFTAFTTFLVANSILTCWQYAKLRNGQYKGFFLDDYKITDHIGSDHTCGRYLAEDTRSQECVVLCVKPPSIAPLKNGKPEYWIEDFSP